MLRKPEKLSKKDFLNIVKDVTPQLYDFYKSLEFKNEENGEYVIVGDGKVSVEDIFKFLPKKSQKIFLQAENDCTLLEKACQK